MAGPAPTVQNTRETDGIVLIVPRITFLRHGMYPAVEIAYRVVKPRAAVDEAGEPTSEQAKNAVGKLLYEDAAGWDEYSIMITSQSEESKALLLDCLKNATVAILQGKGALDIDAALEEQAQRIEGLRRDGSLPQAGVYVSNAP